MLAYPVSHDADPRSVRIRVDWANSSFDLDRIVEVHLRSAHTILAYFRLKGALLPVADVPDAVASISSLKLCSNSHLDCQCLQTAHTGHAEGYRNGFSNAQLEIIVDAGHSPHLELPKKTAGIIVEFMNERT